MSVSLVESRLPVQPIGFQPVRSAAAGREPAALEPGAEVRIGIYNIAHGRGQVASVWEGGDAAARLKRLKDIARLLKDSRLDIVVLNEADFHAPWSKGVKFLRFQITSPKKV